MHQWRELRLIQTIYRNFPKFIRRCKKYRKQIEYALQRREHYDQEHGVEQWIAFTRRRYQWNQMNRKARRKGCIHYWSLHLNNWKRYMEILRSEGDVLLEAIYHDYLLRICGKIITSLQSNVEENKAYRK